MENQASWGHLDLVAMLFFAISPLSDFSLFEEKRLRRYRVGPYASRGVRLGATNPSKTVYKSAHLEVVKSRKQPISKSNNIEIKYITIAVT